MASEGPKPVGTIIVEKEDTQQEKKEEEQFLQEIGQEEIYDRILPSQPYVKLRKESSPNSRGSVTRSREKEQMEDTSKSKEEKNRTPNKKR